MKKLYLTVAAAISMIGYANAMEPKMPASDEAMPAMEQHMEKGKHMKAEHMKKGEHMKEKGKMMKDEHMKKGEHMKEKGKMMKDDMKEEMKKEM